MTRSHFEEWLNNDRERRPQLMGVLNQTPDSFSDGGQYIDSGAAIAHGLRLAANGAAVIDVGGESTRPGAQPVAADEQIRRVVPVIKGLAGQVKALISIDTSRAAVAEAALDAGAGLINDVFAGQDDPALLPLAARRGVPIILMHMQGRPATMQVNPIYSDVMAQVILFLRERVAAAISAGVDQRRILVDPGIGFGKTDEHNLTLLRRLSELKSLGRPIAIGTSRKGFIGRITDEDIAGGRPFGTAATVAWSIANGASLVRVHEVAAMSQVARMIEAIQTGRPADFQPVP